MNNFLLHSSERTSDDIFTVTDKVRVNHIHQTLKLKASDSLKVCLVNSGVTKGSIVELTNDSVKIQASNFEKAQLPWVDLLIGLSRPPTCKKVLEHASTLGAGSFHFFKAALSEKSYLQSKIFENSNYKEFLYNGISQSAIYYKEPSLQLDQYNPVEKYKDVEQKFILSFTTQDTFEDVNIDFSRPICLAIGPERGWTDKEVELFKSNNFKEIRISPSVLRVETATFVALGQLELLKMRNL